MNVVTIAAAKGGATKTTVTALLAVRATKGGKRVAMFDLNGDQGDLTQWYALRSKPRGKPTFLRLIPVEKVSQDIEVCRAEGFDWLFIDTPPSELDLIDNAILKSDAVVIPVRPSIFDIQSVTPIVEICRVRNRPFSFLLSAVDTKMPKLTESAKAALVNDGQIFATRIRYLQAYITAVAQGKTGPEVDKNLETEVDNLWGELQRLVAPGAGKTAAKDRLAS
jgi:chromosome partitioning protein